MTQYTFLEVTSGTQTLDAGNATIDASTGQITYKVDSGYKLVGYQFGFYCESQWKYLDFTLEVIDEFYLAGCTNLIKVKPGVSIKRLMALNEPD